MRLYALLTASAFALAACTQATIVSDGGNDGRNRVVDIVNGTGSNMTGFYAASSRLRGRGPDRLNGSVIDSGGYLTLNFDDGTAACIYDFRAEFSDGSEQRRDDIDVCIETAWTVF